nr:SulP family inorganic anion transporter [Klebsiella variicola]
MMTATIVDDMTDTPSDKNRECKAQGVANICTSFIGGMAGCAMIGQSVINVKSGGRGRLSTLTAGGAAADGGVPARLGVPDTHGGSGGGDDRSPSAPSPGAPSATCAAIRCQPAW